MVGIVVGGREWDEGGTLLGWVRRERKDGEEMMGWFVVVHWGREREETGEVAEQQPRRSTGGVGRSRGV